MSIAAILRLMARREEDDQGSIVSVICVIGWHGEPCDAAREQSASRVPCSCSCHGATS